MLIYAFALAAPVAFTETHQRDIACVATVAILAGEQARGVVVASKKYRDVREAGKDWTPIVGDRVMRETGQPKELVAFAMKEAAKDLRNGKLNSADAAMRTNECIDRMYIDLGNAVLDNAMRGTPLPKPQKPQ